VPGKFSEMRTSPDVGICDSWFTDDAEISEQFSNGLTRNSRLRITSESMPPRMLSGVRAQNLRSKTSVLLSSGTQFPQR
jgi:hypothetical protein